jgi:hypothetical protein
MLQHWIYQPPFNIFQGLLQSPDFYLYHINIHGQFSMVIPYIQLPELGLSHKQFTTPEPFW